MPESIPNNPNCDPPLNSGESKNPDSKYEIITAYLDNELKDKIEIETVEKLIESDPDFFNRYTFEKLSKETLQNKTEKIDVPLYVIKNIGEGIDNLIKSSSKKRNIPDTVIPEEYEKFTGDRSYYKRYFLYGSIAFACLIVFAFIFNSFIKNNPKDLVAVSRNIFDDVESGNVNLQYKCRNAKELEDSMNKYVDFKVYVPDLREAELIGGVCNEINGEKLAHFIYKKNNYLIYTMQGCKEHILSNFDKIILEDDYKSKVVEGKNWLTCNKDKDRTVVLWFNNGVICSSVAHMDSQIMTSTLKNTK